MVVLAPDVDAFVEVLVFELEAFPEALVFPDTLEFPDEALSELLVLLAGTV